MPIWTALIGAAHVSDTATTETSLEKIERQMNTGCLTG